MFAVAVGALEAFFVLVVCKNNSIPGLILF